MRARPEVAPNTPVIVGVGFHQEKLEDPTVSAEPYRLMVEAVRTAAADAGPVEPVLAAIESIAVPQGMWEYRNPAKLVASALGCPRATSILAGLGVLQLGPLFDLCDAIVAGTRRLGVVTAGEAKYRRLRSTITGRPVADTVQGDDTPPPDEHQTSTDLWCSDLESRRGLTSPIEFFAIIESALRHASGLDVERHRDEVAELYSRFSAIAAENPHAWRRERVAADAIRDPSARNAMIAFPYTKLHASHWNVNQGVAVIVASVERARELDVDAARWIYPLAGAHSKHVVPLAQMRSLESHAGTMLCGERALELAGVTMDDVTAAELYSCFPAAIQSFARDLRIPARLPWTVTGSMAFAGGPFNNATVESVARMVEVLRADTGARRVGLVSNLSGIFSKQACAVLSNEPSPEGYRFADVTAEAATREQPVPLRDDYTGPATVAGYTVVFAGGSPSHAIAICDLPDGARTVVRSADPAVLAALMEQEHCGRTITVGDVGALLLARTG